MRAFSNIQISMCEYFKLPTDENGSVKVMCGYPEKLNHICQELWLFANV